MLQPYSPLHLTIFNLFFYSWEFIAGFFLRFLYVLLWDKTPSIAKQVIEDLFVKNKLQEAKKLAVVSIKNIENYRPGTVIDFERWLLKIAEVENDVKTARYYYRKFFIDYHGHDFKYYDKLKHTYKKDTEWKNEMKNLILELKDKKHIILDIHLREDQMDEFIDKIKKYVDDYINIHNSDGLVFLEQYKKPLAKYFPKELIRLYEQGIKKSLVDAKGRSAYQYICQVLKHMKKIGGKKEAESIIQFCRENYRNRPALMDELNYSF